MMRMDKKGTYRPLMILAYADSGHAAQCGRYFRRLGWEVRLVASAAEARRLLAVVTPRVLVLDTHLAGEDGWSSCAALAHGHRVVLLAPERTPEAFARLAATGAAALVSRRDPIEALAETILGKRLAEAV
jgi:DNA-binding response OmpR family regulator